MTAASELFFSDEFDGPSLNDTSWDSFNIGGNISLDGGYLKLISNFSKNFPFVTNKTTIVPAEGDFTIEIKFRYPEITYWGTGIFIGNLVSQYNVPAGYISSNDSQLIQFLVWQSLNDRLLIQTRHCLTDQNCDTSRTNLAIYPNSTLDHVLSVSFHSDRYDVLFDGNSLLNNALLDTTRRPTQVSFGNPEYTNDNLNWTDLWLDYVRVYRDNDVPTPEALKPVIVVPGSGASWDFGAILNGTAGTNWQIPSFVTLYKNLIDSLKNVGYVEGENLFVFGYDWRKGLNNLADDLSGYINGLIAAGEIGADDKIDFIGHSYGGLVARTYGQRTGTGKIDKIVTAGSPHQGLIDAYGIWEGATIWNGDVCQNFALRLTTRANQRLGENELDTIRRLAPGFKDVLPTFDFLKKNGVLVPSASLSQRNQTLIELNTDKALIDGVLWANGGTGNQTIRFVNVTDRDWLDRSFGLWEDGKPIADSPFENTNDGDRAVLASSATNLFSNQATFPADHGGIIGDQSPLEEIFTQLGLESDLVSTTPIADTCRRVFTTFLRSPGTLRVCDQTGICNESLGVYMPSEKLFFIPEYDGQPLNVSVEANGETGHYRLDVGNIDEGGADWDDVRGNLLSPTQTDNYAVVSDGEMTIAGGTGEEARSFDEDVNSLNGLIPNWDKKKLAIARSGSQSLHKRIIAIRQLRELLSKLAIKAHKNNRPDQIEAIIDVWMDIDDLAESVIGSGNTTKAVVLNANINQVERYKTLADRLLKNSSSYYAGTFYTLFSERFIEAKEIRTSQRNLSLDKTLSARYLLLTALGVR